MLRSSLKEDLQKLHVEPLQEVAGDLSCENEVQLGAEIKEIDGI